MSHKDSIQTCCICSVLFKGHGHNPDPFPPLTGAHPDITITGDPITGDSGRACDECNARFVIPARFSAERLTSRDYNLLRWFATYGRQFIGARDLAMQQAQERANEAK